MSSKLLFNILWETFQLVAMLGGALGVVFGILLLVDSPRMFRWGDRLNKWVSTRQAMRRLDASISVERAMYRNHRLIGAVLFLLAAYALYVLLLRYQGAELVAVLQSVTRVLVARWLAESIRVFFIIVNVVAVVLAILMFVRPSSLKGLENWANRHYSGRRLSRPLDLSRMGPDRYVRANPKLVGILLAAGGAYVLIALTLARYVR